MYADRMNRGRMSPTGLTLAVGINAALIAALVWSAPEIGKITDWGTIDTIDIPIEPPPPPPNPPEAKKVTETARPIDTYVPKTVVTIPVPNDNALVGSSEPLVLGDPVALTGTGAGSVTVDPPRPAPVTVDADVDPRYAADLQPDYPPDMRRAGIEGRVVVKVLVGTDGRVKAFEAVSGPGESFFSATRRQAMARWRFKPATRDGVPYESWKTMSLRFRLTE
ncbi:energy transducer TonB [Sphingomonas sp.]|uniref:energy transducer TonB n=1 Tax=Sphingomonas sp. TaxID=28214 RepID=UPI002C6B0846|nr:energy transducer TonB [Sphingomonas sp.]HWK35001.1 energy transducer TonB [Sphingomonas sp.]